MYLWKNMRVCFSGTFNVLHNGHKKLIDEAFKLAGSDGFVYIGITSDEIIKDKKYKISLKKRIDNLECYIKSKGYDKHAKIIVIYDEIEQIKSQDYDAMIVSPETIKKGKEINKIRFQNGKKPLKLVEIPYVLAEDNKPISSTRIIEKKIKKDGSFLSK
jgi:pantetheine-phosphate adenylyltransferase